MSPRNAPEPALPCYYSFFFQPPLIAPYFTAGKALAGSETVED